jgi:hypothetical protein
MPCDFRRTFQAEPDYGSIAAISTVSDSHGRIQAAPTRTSGIDIAMDLNRHQFLFIGLLVLFVGLQVRYVSSYVLNPQTTQFLADHTGQGASSFAAATAGTFGAARKIIQPPEWLSWCLISVGAVLCLHSLAMPKPG